MPKTFTFQVRYRKCLLFGICPLAATPKWAHPKRRWPKVADCVPFSHKLEINMLMKFTFHMPASRGRWIYLVFLPRGQTGISRRHCHISWQGFNARNSAADGEMEPKFYWVVGSANVASRGIGVIAPCDPAVCHTFFFFLIPDRPRSKVQLGWGSESCDFYAVILYCDTAGNMVSIVLDCLKEHREYLKSMQYSDN